jgi:glutathione S-transferase
VSDSRIVLYGPRAPLTEKVARGLRLKRVAFERVEPNSPEDYARLSPETGLLPLLEVEGVRIPDSVAILDFLDERFPEPRLVSADPRVARAQRRLEKWNDETFAFYILRWVQNRLGPGAPMPVHGGFPLGSLLRLGLIDSRGKLRSDVFSEKVGGPGPEFEHRLEDLVHLLGQRPFFYADQISRADLSVCASLSVMYREVYEGARQLLETRPRLLAYVERVLHATGGAEPIRSGSVGPSVVRRRDETRTRRPAG